MNTEIKLERKITIKRLNNLLDSIVISFNDDAYSYTFQPDQAKQLGMMLMDITTNESIDELTLTLNKGDKQNG